MKRVVLQCQKHGNAGKYPHRMIDSCGMPCYREAWVAGRIKLHFFFSDCFGSLIVMPIFISVKVL